MCVCVLQENHSRFELKSIYPPLPPRAGRDTGSMFCGVKLV